MGRSFLTHGSCSLPGFKLASDGDSTVTLSFIVLAGRNIFLAANLNPSCFLLSPLHLTCSGRREHIIALFAPTSNVFQNLIIALPISLLLCHRLFSRLNKCEDYFRLPLEAVLVDLQLVSLPTTGLAPGNSHLS